MCQRRDLAAPSSSLCHEGIGKYLVQQNSKRKAKKGGDSACPCQTSLTGFTARTGQAGSQLACLRWPVLVPGPEQAGFPAVSKLS
jgi:hypothetical protein